MKASSLVPYVAAFKCGFETTYTVGTGMPKVSAHRSASAYTRGNCRGPIFTAWPQRPPVRRASTVERWLECCDPKRRRSRDRCRAHSLDGDSHARERKPGN